MDFIIPGFSRGTGPGPGTRLWEGFLEILFPRPCACCGQPRRGAGPCLCVPCRNHFNCILPPFCGRCGWPAPIDYDYPGADFLCGMCRKRPLAFDRARSLGTYESVVRSLICFFKYQKQPVAVKEFIPALEAHFQGERERYAGFGVVPVPLHVKKLKVRGFNQAFIVAREVARILSLPIWTKGLVRVRETPPQAGLSRRQRMENLRGAFLLDRPEEWAGKRVLLVDDVLTTGATAHEVARLLKRAGVKAVHVITLARA